MLEPWERKVFNIAMVLILVMSLYTGWVFLPHHTVIQHSLGLLASLFNGSSEGDLQTATAAMSGRASPVSSHHLRAPPLLENIRLLTEHPESLPSVAELICHLPPCMWGCRLRLANGRFIRVEASHLLALDRSETAGCPDGGNQISATAKHLRTCMQLISCGNSDYLEHLSVLDEEIAAVSLGLCAQLGSRRPQMVPPSCRPSGPDRWLRFLLSCQPHHPPEYGRQQHTDPTNPILMAIFHGSRRVLLSPDWLGSDSNLGQICLPSLTEPGTRTNALHAAVLGAAASAGSKTAAAID
uniref:Fe2OG dioxygenase domain-containing protein n=1 Tax=Macrostomum lignano TaxID=282301 RepID=A0A1I8JMI0_9PLAT